jgi:ribosomal protein S18 acetylase RimI-like enzyme
MEDKLNVRFVNRDDYAEMADLLQMAQAAQIEERALEGDRDAEKWSRQAAESLEDSLKDERDAYFVASAESGLAGYALYVYDQTKPNEGWIYDLYVKPEYRGHALALKMMAAAQELAAHQGVKVIKAFTHVANQATQKINEQFGFVRVPELEEPDKYVSYEKVVGQ